MQLYMYRTVWEFLSTHGVHSLADPFKSMEASLMFEPVTR